MSSMPQLEQPDRIIVTAVPAIGQLHFSRREPDGTETEAFPPATGAPHQIGLLSLRLASMYLTLGPGAHTKPELCATTGYTVQAVHSALVALGGLVPSEVMQLTFDVGKPKGGRPPIIGATFGQLALASRQPTEQELAAKTAQARKGEQAGLERRKSAVLAAEPEKTNLTIYDHAVCTVDDRKYVLPFAGGRQSILASRVVAAVGELPPSAEKEFSATAVVSRVWAAMPVAERRLFTGIEQGIFGSTAPIGRHVEAILNDLTSFMQITRRATRIHTYWRLTGQDGVGVDFKTAPLDAPYAGYGKIFPPGTPISDLAYGEGSRSASRLTKEWRIVWDAS